MFFLDRTSSVLIVTLKVLCVLSTITVPVHGQLSSSKNYQIENKNAFNYRLPRHIIPKNYTLNLQPHMQNKTFDGKVNIIIKVLEPTDLITLHSNKLIVNSVSLKDNSDKNVFLSSNLTNDKREFLNIYLRHKIPTGIFMLDIEFSGSLSGLVGLYASTLKSSKFPADPTLRDSWIDMLRESRQQNPI